MSRGALPETPGRAGAAAAAPRPPTDPPTDPTAGPPVGPAGRMRRKLDGSTTVVVDGVTVADPEPTFPGPALPAVTVRMPGFLAHHLAHVLADWSHLCDLMGAQRSEEWDLAQALHDAARTTGETSARACPATRTGLRVG